MTEKIERVLVTGGAGFIGSHLVEQLLSEHQQVRVLEKPGVSTAHLPGQVEVVLADIGEADGIEQAARDCDVVLHLAANPNLWARAAGDFERVNHQGTRHVLAAARAAGARRVVHVSTESILARAGSEEAVTEETETSLEDMIGPYCRSKWLAETAAREAAAAGQPVVIVSPTVPVGPGDHRLGPPSRLICDFLNGKIKGYLDGDINLIDVRDVATGIWAAARHGDVGRRYLLANENWQILDLMRFLADVSDRPAPRWRVPYTAALGFAYVEEWVCRHLTKGVPLATVTGVRLTRRTLRFDGSRSARDLGLEPMRSCRDAITESIDWFRASGHVQ